MRDMERHERYGRHGRHGRHVGDIREIRDTRGVSHDFSMTRRYELLVGDVRRYSRRVDMFSCRHAAKFRRTSDKLLAEAQPKITEIRHASSDEESCGNR